MKRTQQEDKTYYARCACQNGVNIFIYDIIENIQSAARKLFEAADCTVFNLD